MITIDDWGVRRPLSDGTREQVAWGDLTEVAIVTTDDAPYGEDVFYLLTGKEGGCLVPQGRPKAWCCCRGSSSYRDSTTGR